MRPAPLLLTLALAFAATVEAQIPATNPAPITVPDTLPRERERARASDRADTLARLRPLIGLHWTTSTGVTAHLGLMFAGPQGRHGEYGGPVVSAEVGQHGWKGGIGLGGRALISDILVRASYLGTWGDDGPLAPDQGYVGVDGRIAISHVAVGVGWHARVSGEAHGDGSIFTFSIGLGI